MAPTEGRVARPERRWGCCHSTPGRNGSGLLGPTWGYWLVRWLKQHLNMWGMTGGISYSITVLLSVFTAPSKSSANAAVCLIKKTVQYAVCLFAAQHSLATSSTNAFYAAWSSHTSLCQRYAHTVTDWHTTVPVVSL